MRRVVFAFLCQLTVSTSALNGAQAGDVSEEMLRQFLVSAAPPGFDDPRPGVPSGAPALERTNAIDGTKYAVIAPIYTGADGNTSFIRMANLVPPGTSGNMVAFPISVVGVPSGTVYGTTTYTITRF